MIGYGKIEGLLIKNDDQFYQEQISELDVNMYQKKLQDHYDLFENLHQRCCFIGPVFKEEARELDEQEIEFRYSNQLKTEPP